MARRALKAAAPPEEPCEAPSEDAAAGTASEVRPLRGSFPPRTEDQPYRFRVDRHVTLALILALALQAGGVLVWVGRTAARIDELELRIDRQGPIAERLARLEEQAATARATLDRIEMKLDRLEGRRGR